MPPIPIPIPIPSYRPSSSSFSPPDSGYATLTTTSTQSSLSQLPKSKISIDNASTSSTTIQIIPSCTSPVPGRQDLIAYRMNPEVNVLERYKEILPEIQKILQRFLVSAERNLFGKKKKTKCGPVAVRLMMVGSAYSGGEVKPTIVIFIGGEDKLVKGIEGLMKKEGQILCRPDDGVMPDFEVIVIGEGVRKRSGEVKVVWDREKGWMMRGRERGVVTYCGRRIRFENEEGESSCCTLGGLVKLVGGDGGVRVVGITAGHVLEGLFDDEEEEEEENELFFAGDYTERMPRRAVGQLLYPEIPEYLVDQDVSEFIPARDWALFELDEKTKLKPNILERPGLDWEQHRNGRSNRDEMTVAPSNAFPSQSPIEVAMLTQSNYPRGVKLGVLSHLTGGLMLNPEKGFVEAYLLQLDEGEEIEDGDSGAWVINPVSKEVFGQVVATDYTGDAYIIPLHAIFDEIKENLGVQSVGLPTTADLLNIALRATTITVTEPDSLIVMTARVCSRERHMSDLLTSYYGEPSSLQRRSLLSDRDSGYGSPGSPIRYKPCRELEEWKEDEYGSW
ncbi:hypothetical protein QBC38DRAFT_505179 [Podospora fimiseda]|uniref:Uncharacterized protein n=1 Tax=Podospora fimiseda TaxID=252190 RepID=A0AAN6YRI5_9PEZI|nr:hypothetical protein QBC38DRAFT_505179 [Podospora fimiseda]